MLRIALRGVRAHLVRFGMSVLAVVLGVAFVSGTFSLREMLSGTFDDIVSASTTADVYVRVPTSATQVTDGSSTVTAGGLPLDLAATIATADGVDRVLPSISGPIVLVGADGTAVRSSQAPSMAIGFDPDDHTVTLTGRAPHGPDEIALEAHTLAASGLAVGDTTRVLAFGQPRQVTVVGSVDYAAPMAGATIVVLDEATLESLYVVDGTVSSFAVYADQGVSQQTLRDHVADTLASAGTGTGTSAEVVTRAQVIEQTTAQIDKQLGFVTTFLLVFAALALFVGAFIIANTFTMSVRQRMREFALLRAVGASPAQVFASLLIQAGVIGLVGSAIGVLAGLGLVQALRSVFAQMGMTLSDQVPLRPGTVAIAVALGTLTCLGATLLPARRAALVAPVEAMAEQTSITERSLRWRALTGAVLLVAGVLGVVWATGHPGADRTDLVLGVGASATLIGVLVLGPVVVPAVVRLLAVPLVRWWRPIGRLAAGNVVRNPRRAANTAGALTIGMALVGATTVLAASTQASVTGMIDQQITADYVLRADYPDNVSEAVVTAARQLDGVATVSPLPYAAVQVDGTPGGIAEADPALIGTSLNVPMVQGDAAAALRAGDVLVQKQKADKAGWAVGDRLTFTGPLGSTTLRIGAIQESAVLGDIQAPPGTLAKLVPSQQVRSSTALVTLAPGADSAKVRTELVDLVKPYVVVSVMDSAQFVDSMASQVDQVLTILYALLGLSIVIAVLGIVNTLALSVVERTREIGLLRAVGLGRLQLAGTVTVESVLTAATGTLVGLAVGVGLASALPTVYADQGLSQLAVPWASLAAMVGLAVLVGVLAALWPGVRAARLKVLDAVSYE